MGHYASECQTKRREEEVNLTRTYDEELALMMAVSQEETQGGQK